MSRYDGLIIPRSYSEYINKTDAATLQQALQLSGVLSGNVAAGDNKAVTSNAVNNALAKYQPKGVYTQLVAEYQIDSSSTLTKIFKLTNTKLYILYSYIWNNHDVMGMYMISMSGNGVVIKPILNNPFLTVKGNPDTLEISCEYDWSSAGGVYCFLDLCMIN